MSQPARVLVVEDEAIVAEDLANKVNALGYQLIGIVPTGEEALQLAQAQCPDLVLLDVRLEGPLDGIETAERLNELGVLAIVFVTAHSDRESIERAKRIVDCGFVLKPYGERDLAVQLDIALYKAQTNRALRDNEQRWHLAVTGSTDGIWDWDIVRHTAFLSTRWKELRGYCDEEIGDDETEWSSRIHPEDYEMVMRTVASYLERKTPSYQCEYRTRRKDGTYRWIIDRGVAVWDTHGRAVRMVGSETDITDRKLAEAALREREAELEIIVNRTPFLLTRCSRDLRYRFVSQAYADMVGCRAADIVGRRIVDILGETGLRNILPYIQQVLNGDSVEYEKEFNFNGRGNRFLHVNYTPDKDRSGTTIGWIASILDITERKRVEDQLRESEARFRNTADTAPVLIWMSDTTKLCTWFNKPWLAFTGRSMEQELGNGWAELVHPDDFDRCLQIYTTSFEARQSFEMEYRLRRHDGQYRWLLDHGIPRYAEGGQFLGYIGSCMDVTEHKQGDEAVRAVALFPNQNPQPVLRINTAGLLLYTNPAGARIFKELRVGEGVPLNLRTLVLTAFHADQVQETEQQIGSRHYLVTTAPIVGAGYANLYWFDITERKQAEAALRESERRLREECDIMQRLQALSTRLIHAGDLLPLLQEILATAADLIGTDKGNIQLLDPKTGNLRIVAHQGLGKRVIEHFAEHGWVATCEAAMQQAQRVIVEDVTREPTVQGTIELEIVLQDGIRAIQSTPLMSRDGRLLGMLNNHFRFVHRPSESDLWSLDVLARMAADLIEREQSSASLRESEERCRRLAEESEQRVTIRTHELFQSQERLRALATELNLSEQRERNRLATELHDHLQQLLVLGKLQLGQGKRVGKSAPECVQVFERTDQILSDALAYTRTLAAELSPPVLREHGLCASLKWLGEYMKKHDLAVTVTFPDGKDPQVPEDQAILLFQSIRELLINASKHAGTQNASLILDERDGHLIVQVIDHGKGFDPSAVRLTDADSAGGLSSKFGLFSIRERMIALGGWFDIQSASQQGTTATLRLPLNTMEVSKQPPMPLDIVHPQTPQQPRIGPQPIRVLLVDDHAMVRQGLKTLLENYADIEVIGEAANGEEAVSLAGELKPTIVVMDVHMPRMNGIQATAVIKERHREMTVIGLSVNCDDGAQRAMKDAGALAIITKEAAVEQLYGKIHEAIHGSLSTERSTLDLFDLMATQSEPQSTVPGTSL